MLGVDQSCIYVLWHPPFSALLQQPTTLTKHSHKLYLRIIVYYITRHWQDILGWLRQERNTSEQEYKHLAICSGAVGWWQDSQVLRSILLCSTLPGFTFHHSCFPTWLLVSRTHYCLEFGRVRHWVSEGNCGRFRLRVVVPSGSG